MHATRLIWVFALVLASCATISPVRPLGDGGYIVVGSHPPWTPGAYVEFRRHVLEASVAYCTSMGRKINARELRQVLQPKASVVATFDCI